VFDIAIIGGGVNGCGIARDAAGRGLKVYLCESNDLGSATSAASTKLLHGGLRYLEHFEFRLVREALQERETLWKIAPHIVRPLRFVLPHVKGMRPQWLLRTGLFLYDHLGGRDALPGTATVDLSQGPLAQGLRPDLKRGFEYSDCWVEDSRLVLLNARTAQRDGAVIEPHTRCTAATVDAGLWTVTVFDRASGGLRQINARTLVNAAGPWANEVARQVVGRPPKGRVRLVQGSHIVVKKRYDHDRCFIFQNRDGRVFFSIPYEDDFTLIGTTDNDYTGTLDRVEASEQEVGYLCASVSEYFSEPVTVGDVVWSYSGVRPLYDDGASAAQVATRDYTLELDAEAGAPLLSIFGGKITTYRRLAEAALSKLEPFFTPPKQAVVRQRRGWTARKALVGGDFAPQEFAAKEQALRAAYPFLPPQLAVRLTRYYGTDAPGMLAGAHAMADLGRDFGAGLTEREVEYMREHEWALTADDVLWRRSKLGLRLDAAQRQALADHMDALAAAASRPMGAAVNTREETTVADG
jgi:glycerol-3-phosphate dehydrogenase